MYEEYFGLREKPFSVVPDPRFMYLGTGQRGLLARILRALEQGRGLIRIVGPVGSGKTTLARALLERIGPEHGAALIHNPSPSADELRAAICIAFGLEQKPAAEDDALAKLGTFLKSLQSAHRRALLVIDEAQNLDPDVLDEIRLLSNPERGPERPLQILLFGQPELDENLARAGLSEQFAGGEERWELGPMTSQEIGPYLEHRLRLAGGAGKEVFSRRAVRRIHRASAGIPRLVNVLADRSLLAAFSLGRRRVSARQVRLAAREISAPEGSGWPASFGLSRRAAAVALLTGALVGGSSAVWTGLIATGATPDPATASGLAQASLPPVGAPNRGSQSGGLSAPRAGVASPAQSDSGSASAAVDAVLAAWGYPALQLEALEFVDVGRVIESVTPLQALEVVTTLDQLQQLDLPVILELDEPGAGRGYVALVAVAADGSLRVSGESGVASLSPSELLKRWSGRSLLLWTNFEAVPELEHGDSGAWVEWLQVQLRALGALDRKSPSGDFDAPTMAGVARFQSRYGLAATGAVDEMTLLALYQAMRSGSPRIAKGEEAL